METIDEREIGEFLDKDLSAEERQGKILRRINNPSLSWDEKRVLWMYLYNSGQDALLADTLITSLRERQRVPLDLLIEVTARANVKPSSSTLESLFKGLKKQASQDEVLHSKGWDKWDSRFKELREIIFAQKHEEQKKFKENLLEKFWFLRNQRMNAQASSALQRLIELFPGEPQFLEIKKEFSEQLARDVLADHLAGSTQRELNRAPVHRSEKDVEMLGCFAAEAKSNPTLAGPPSFDLAVAFWFMEDFDHALAMLAGAPDGEPKDWMLAETLYAARRFVQALEHLNQLELKYNASAETSFSVSYLRAQCLFALGQQTTALEILQSLVQIRPNYRSAQALILDWTQGAKWE